MQQPNRREKKGLVIFLIVIALVWISVELFSYFQRNEPQSKQSKIENIVEETTPAPEKTEKNKKLAKDEQRRKSKPKSATQLPQPKPASPLERPVKRKTDQ